MLKIKRAYEKAEKADGTRILIDRLWPRGISKEEAKIDLWMHSIAPSNELRQWFGHEPEKWQGFKEKYFEELEQNKNLLEPIATNLKKKDITLVYGAHDPDHNNAAALKEYIEKNF